MRPIVYLLLIFFVFYSTLDAQSKEAEKAEIHPAVTAALTWAKAVKNGKATPENDILDPAGRLAIKIAKDEMGDIDKDISQFILKDGSALSFQPAKDNPNQGMLTFGGEPRFPMYRKDGRWYCNLIKVMESIKLDAEKSQAEMDIISLGTGLQSYRRFAGTYPSTKQGLMALLRKPTTEPRPRRWAQLVAKPEAFKDPWGNPYRYQLVDGKPVITSLGPDGIVSKDDISVEE
jgi:type II secretion system protein G